MRNIKNRSETKYILISTLIFLNFTAFGEELEKVKKSWGSQDFVRVLTALQKFGLAPSAACDKEGEILVEGGVEEDIEAVKKAVNEAPGGSRIFELYEDRGKKYVKLLRFKAADELDMETAQNLDLFGRTIAFQGGVSFDEISSSGPGMFNYRSVFPDIVFPEVIKEEMVSQEQKKEIIVDPEKPHMVYSFGFGGCTGVAGYKKLPDGKYKVYFSHYAIPSLDKYEDLESLDFALLYKENEKILNNLGAKIKGKSKKFEEYDYNQNKGIGVLGIYFPGNGEAPKILKK